jgi:hypothetical protein
MRATSNAQPQMLMNVSVAAVDRTGNESNRTIIPVQQ